MNLLSIDQLRDLADRLNRLSELNAERDAASAESAAANRRWNKARGQYAEVHAGIVAVYGEQHAPRWFDSINGPRVA